jgi:hypothetical protein
MRKRSRGIVLHRETLRRLEHQSLREAAGGTDTADTCARSQCQGELHEHVLPIGVPDLLLLLAGTPAPASLAARCARLGSEVCENLAWRRSRWSSFPACRPAS